MGVGWGSWVLTVSPARRYTVSEARSCCDSPRFTARSFLGAHGTGGRGQLAPCSPLAPPPRPPQVFLSPCGLRCGWRRRAGRGGDCAGTCTAGLLPARYAATPLRRIRDKHIPLSHVSTRARAGVHTAGVKVEVEVEVEGVRGLMKGKYDETHVVSTIG